jgi:hypothetical protein
LKYFNAKQNECKLLHNFKFVDDFSDPKQGIEDLEMEKQKLKTDKSEE